MIRRAWLTLPSCFASSSTPILLRMIFSSLVIVSSPRSERLSGFPCKGRFHHAKVKRSSNRMASWAFAITHSLGGIFHSFAARFNTRNRSLSALSSEGKCPLVLTARRSLAFKLSIEFLITHHPQPIPDVEQLFEISVLRFLQGDHPSPVAPFQVGCPSGRRSQRACVPDLNCQIHRHLGS